MTNQKALFFHLDLYSSLPVPGPIPIPPDPFFVSSHHQQLHMFAGKILGRMKLSAPSDAPINGIGVAPGWLTDTRPVGLTESDREPFCESKVHSIYPRHWN